MTKKRRHERVDAIHLSYICIDEAGNVVHEGMGRTLNVSEAGILLETSFGTEPGQSLNVTLAIGEDLLDVNGKVVRVEEKDEVCHAGVEFQDLSGDDRSKIREFMEMFRSQQGEPDPAS
ncbi:MAG: PilZ domain-containing protein [Desulfococcaceae bacterium]